MNNLDAGIDERGRAGNKVFKMNSRAWLSSQHVWESAVQLRDNPSDIPSRVELNPASTLNFEPYPLELPSEWDESGGVGRFESGTYGCKK